VPPPERNSTGAVPCAMITCRVPTPRPKVHCRCFPECRRQRPEPCCSRPRCLEVTVSLPAADARHQMALHTLSLSLSRCHHPSVRAASRFLPWCRANDAVSLRIRSNGTLLPPKGRRAPMTPALSGRLARCEYAMIWHHTSAADNGPPCEHLQTSAAVNEATPSEPRSPAAC
jgi:hypothetical protein